MKLGIDLHNIRDGGGVNYIANLCAVFDPARHGFSALVLYGAKGTLDQIATTNPYIEKRALPILSKGVFHRLRFLFFQLDAELRQAGCGMLYSPGGLYLGGFRPYGSISRNMMPFQLEQWGGYRSTRDIIRLHLLRWANARTFRRADAMIFLTRVAQQSVSRIARMKLDKSRVIAHGVDRTVFAPLANDGATAPSTEETINIVYPSRLEPYKHQIEAMEAVASLRKEFRNIALTMCGPANPEYGARVGARRLELDPDGNFLHYVGQLNTADLVAHYRQSTLLLFVSSCENLPNTLIEAMAAQIPVVTSDCEPMPSVGRDGCLYVDPTDAPSIAGGIRQALADWPATSARRQRAAELASVYSWQKCADETFSYLHDVARNHRAS